MEKETLIVDGFVFSTYKEAQIAVKEKQNIEVIRTRTSFSDSNAVFELYTKLIERNMFKTMVGYSFLFELRHLLTTEFGYDETELPTVKLPGRMEYDTVSEINQGKMEAQIQALLLIKKRMTIVIVALAVMVLSMFVIAAINPNVGYLNTEKKILNKYSAWEEDLKQREQAVKEKEEQFNTKSKK